MLSDDLRKRRLPVLDSDLSILRMHDGHELSMVEREDLLVKVGQGTDKVGSLLQRLDLLRELRSTLPATPRRAARFQRKDALLEIEGGVPMPIKFAKCCKPNEGEHGKIAGFIGRDGTVMVHGWKCRNAIKGNPDRRVVVRWRKES